VGGCISFPSQWSGLKNLAKKIFCAPSHQGGCSPAMATADLEQRLSVAAAGVERGEGEEETTDGKHWGDTNKVGPSSTAMRSSREIPEYTKAIG